MNVSCYYDFVKKDFVNYSQEKSRHKQNLPAHLPARNFCQMDTGPGLTLTQVC